MLGKQSQALVHEHLHARQVWNEKGADKEVLAMVVRTGLCTAMGDMLRQVMAPLHEPNTLKDPFVEVRLTGTFMMVQLPCTAMVESLGHVQLRHCCC